MRRDEDYGEKIDDDECGGGRRKVRPKRRWVDSVNVDLRENRLSERRCKPGCVEVTCQKHRAPVEVRKDVVEEEEQYTTNNKPFPMILMSSVPSLQHTFSCQSIWKMKIMTLK